MSSEQLHMLLAVGVLFVTGLKAGKATSSWLHQQWAQPVALGNPSMITQRSEFTGKGISHKRSRWLNMGSTSVPLRAQHNAAALIQLAIIWVWEKEYGIFQTSETVNAGKKVFLEAACNGSKKTWGKLPSFYIQKPTSDA